MGLGDEIMALGRAEQVFEETGQQVSICSMTEAPREHDIWHGNPAWVHKGGKIIIDGGGARPYIKHWKNRQAIYNLDYRPRAGRIYLTDEARAACTLEGPYAVIEPFIKPQASINKNWGPGKWEKVIEDFPIPVYQLIHSPGQKTIKGAIPYKTPTIHDACAAIEKAAFVMCNEGGTHHMAASMRTPAVVIFGSFIPPQVTGYDFHVNISVPEYGFCGKWDRCPDCEKALKSIKPEYVREEALKLWDKVK
jgi:ADP-heptose:LPS heptosyltransferase